MRFPKKQPTGAENYSVLQKVWGQEKRLSFKDFFCWYNKKDVLTTLEAMQKMVKFYHNKRIDMLKLGCILLNLANICLHNSTSAKLYPTIGREKKQLSKIWEDMVGGQPIVFTGKVVVDETHICKSTNVFKAIVGKDASQYHPYSICQPIHTRLYTKYEFDADLQRFKPLQNKSRTNCTFKERD